MKTTKYLLAILFGVIAFGATACGGGSSRIEGEISDAENDERLGRTVIRCAVEEFDAARVAAVNEFFENMNQTQRALGLAARETASVSVPLVLHVIASGPTEAEGNVSDETLAAQVAFMNAAFSGSAGGVATPFTFVLTGVTRTIDSRLALLEFGSAEELEAKQALRQGGPETLNMYVAASDVGTLGYATFPWEFGNAPVLDGVVVDFRTLPGGSFGPYGEGDTAVHEIGHWLGLFHSFQGGCGSINDDIDDTPAESRPSIGCPIGRNTCGGDAGIDPINNYMDYSDDFCLFEFSPGQVERMDIFSLVFRAL